jgi:glycosyltransferase involved in cell wall biosynthesis
MAQVSYFVFSPNAIVSAYGLLYGPDRTVPTPAEDWRTAVVDVVIPALNEEATIALSLASIARQTLKPRHIILVDDGSRDRTVRYAESFCRTRGLNVQIIKRAKPIGKTPTIKRQSREFDADVEFILDGDTVLESDNYIERTVEELYQAAGIASACGVILPLGHKDRARLMAGADMREFHAIEPEADEEADHGWWQLALRGLTNIYRDALYMFLQKFIYRGQMAMFGTITNPVGCAVAYRRKYVKQLFDRYEPILGDDLTNSEDIFIGFAMLNQGYRNIQLTDVYARTMEPRAQSLPRQIYMWSSSFLQSCYYFDPLVRSPLRWFKHALHEWRQKREPVAADSGRALRKIQEPYRQAWGEKQTLAYGRPIGWTLMMSVIEKIAFPTTLIIMIILQMWEPLAITLAAETALVLTALTVVSRGQRVEYFCKGLLVTPLRYLYIAFDMLTIARFAGDLWLWKSRKWRK